MTAVIDLAPNGYIVVTIFSVYCRNAGRHTWLCR